MSIEALVLKLLFGLLPGVAGVFAMILSYRVASKTRCVSDTIASIVVVVVVVLSLLMLFGIWILGGWPTFLPHILIGFALLLVSAQCLLLKFRIRKSPELTKQLNK